MLVASGASIPTGSGGSFDTISQKEPEAAGVPVFKLRWGENRDRFASSLMFRRKRVRTGELRTCRR